MPQSRPAKMAFLIVLKYFRVWPPCPNKRIVLLVLVAAMILPAGCNQGGSSSKTPPTSTLTSTASCSTPPQTAWPSTATATVGEGQGDYEIGNAVLTDIWVDPENGRDTASGESPAQSLKTIAAAWSKIPSGTALTATGFRLQLLPGIYPAYDQDEANVPGQFADRLGAYACPIIIQAAEGPGTVNLPGFEVNHCQYIYFINLNTRGPSPGGDGFHLSSCRYVLIRGCEIHGDGRTQEVLKANQCQYVFVEGSRIHGPTDNVCLDFVAVQYGHICRNTIYDAADWCIYLKGGSSYFRIEGNEIYNAGNGGFTAGQGSGFEYMVNPWLHYEAYDIKFINNVVHDTDGAGMGINGGYNILLAHNTLYRVGRNSHAVEVVFGGRGCGGEADHLAAARANHAAGGWGRAEAEDSQYYIPNKNVLIYNNIIYNPPGYQSAWSHFTTRADTTPPPGTNAPNPCRGDDNLQIFGNFIWNGPSSLDLGIGDEGQARLDPAKVRAQNSINSAQPQLINPRGGDFRPVADGNILRVAAYAIPDFSWAAAPSVAAIPPGNPGNSVPKNKANENRMKPFHPGAY